MAEVLGKKFIVEKDNIIHYNYRNVDIIVKVIRIKNDEIYEGQVLLTNVAKESNLWQIGTILKAMKINLNDAGWDTAEIL